MTKSRLTQLETLRAIIADEIDARPGARDLAGLAKQYREVLQEIDFLKGGEDDDEIDQLINERAADGKSGAVRKSSTRV